MIKVINVKTPEEGAYKAVAFLQQYVDEKTLLLLSGGKSPALLYQLLASSVDFRPASVALVDERYGSPFHENSNEKMIKDSGLFGYFESLSIPFSRILTCKNYSQTIQNLFKKFPKKVAIMGIGEDGHTAGIAPNRPDFKNPIFDDKKSLVASFDDKIGPYGERITLTFKALEMIDIFIILVFGENKKEALEIMLGKKVKDQTGMPAIFFRKTKNCVILITDQSVVQSEYGRASKEIT